MMHEHKYEETGYVQMSFINNARYEHIEWQCVIQPCKKVLWLQTGKTPHSRVLSGQKESAVNTPNQIQMF